jgi:hypothetical protein
MGKLNTAGLATVPPLRVDLGELVAQYDEGRDELMSLTRNDTDVEIY